MQKLLFVFILTSISLMWLCYGSAAQNLHWQDKTPQGVTKPPGRRGSALAWTPTALFLFGGENNDSVLGDMWKFSLLDNKWKELRLIKKPAPRHDFVAGAFEDYWYISHGKGSSDHLDDSWVFDFAAEEWTQLNFTRGADIPEARYQSAGGGVAAREVEREEDDVSEVVMVWMSMGENKVGRKLSDTWVLTVNLSEPFQGEWERVSEGAGLNQYDPTLPHARAQAAGMPFAKGKFIINGGCSSGGQVGGPCPLEDTWMFSSSDSSWSRLASCPIPAHSSSMAPLNSQMLDVGVLYGGTQEGHGLISQVLSSSALNADEVTLINITSLKWSRIKVNSSNGGTTPPARSSPHMAPSAQGIYMFGGKAVEGNGNYLNDLWLLETNGGGKPESLPCTYTWFSFLHLHGVLMYIAWGLLLPFGAMMGRYYRWSWPVWFIIHVTCQVFGTILTIGGFAVVFLVAEEPSHPHGVIGIILMALIAQQFLSGIIRPWLGREDGRYAEDCKKKDTFKYKWRRCWEVYHRVSGIIAIALGFAQVTLGVFLINAPVPVWGVWLGLLCLWLAVYLFHEIVHCTCVRLHKE